MRFATPLRVLKGGAQFLNPLLRVFLRLLETASPLVDRRLGLPGAFRALRLDDLEGLAGAVQRFAMFAHGFGELGQPRIFSARRRSGEGVWPGEGGFRRLRGLGLKNALPDQAEASRLACSFRIQKLGRALGFVSGDGPVDHGKKRGLVVSQSSGGGVDDPVIIRPPEQTQLPHPLGQAGVVGEQSGELRALESGLVIEAHNREGRGRRAPTGQRKQPAQTELHGWNTPGGEGFKPLARDKGIRSVSRHTPRAIGTGAQALERHP